MGSRTSSLTHAAMSPWNSCHLFWFSLLASPGRSDLLFTRQPIRCQCTQGWCFPGPSASHSAHFQSSPVSLPSPSLAGQGWGSLESLPKCSVHAWSHSTRDRGRAQQSHSSSSLFHTPPHKCAPTSPLQFPNTVASSLASSLLRGAQHCLMCGWLTHLSSSWTFTVWGLNLSVGHCRMVPVMLCDEDQSTRNGHSEREMPLLSGASASKGGPWSMSVFLALGTLPGGQPCSRWLPFPLWSNIIFDWFQNGPFEHQTGPSESEFLDLVPQPCPTCT